MAQATEKQSTVGYSLHLRATDLINDFLKETEGHFQYLQEILAEAKEHFARRDSVHLLPKTPCAKTKRRRIVQECTDSTPTLASSPTVDFHLENASSTPENKNVSLENLSTKNGFNETLNESKRTSKSTRARANKHKGSSKPQRKQPRRGAKKASNAEVITASENYANAVSEQPADTNNKEVTPKRSTRCKRKQADKESNLSNGSTHKKTRCSVSEEKIVEKETQSPKKSTRNKVKESVKESVVQVQSANKISDVSHTPSPQLKKSKITHPKVPVTLQNAEVSVPETSQEHQSLNTPNCNKEGKVVRSSIKVVLSPPVVASPDGEQDVCAYDVGQKDELPSKVVVVEAVCYEENNPKDIKQESRYNSRDSEPISESSISSTTILGHDAKPQVDTPKKIKLELSSDATVSSTKKLKHETRASLRGSKRKQGSKDNQDKKARLWSTSSNDSHVQEESACTAQLEKQPNSCSAEEETVSSTTTTMTPKVKRKTLRSSRTTRRSSRQSTQNSRKSIRIRKSRSLIKSSVMLKLSATKLRPALAKRVKENDSLNDENNVQVNIMKEFESTCQNVDIISEQSQATTIPDNAKNVFENVECLQATELEDKDSSNEEGDIANASIAQDEGEENSPEIKESVQNGDIGDDNGGLEEVRKKENEDATELNDLLCQDEFHDAQETSLDEDDVDEQFHDASDAVVAENILSSPVTRLSLNHSSGSDSTQRSNSASSDDQSTCKQSDDDYNRTQSSPEAGRENCLFVESNDDDKDNVYPENPYGFENKVLKPTNAGLIYSFIKRNTPKKVNRQEKSHQMKLAILEKQEKEKERIQRLAQQKQKKIEDQKRRREEKERKVAELRAAKTREQKEKNEQLEKKQEMRKLLEDKARKIKEREEEAKRKARQEKKAECDARRKQEEEQRKQKQREKEEEERKHRDMMQRKAEFEEQERQRKLLEAKRHQEFREQELQRAKELEKLRVVKEKEESERKAKEEKEKQERKLKEEMEKEERERKRIAALFREKEEQERRDNERKAKEEQLRKEREMKVRLQEEQERERQRLRKLQEQREAEEAKVRALRKVMHDTYDMTPPPPPKVRCVSTAENYNIDDICSDDSTDDEDAPRKKIPQWAQGAKLKAAILSQSDVTIEEIEAIFGGVAMPNLDDIFTQKKRKRFYQRTSSAHWETPPLKPVNRGTLI